MGKRVAEPQTDLKAVVPELEELSGLAAAGRIEELVDRLLDVAEERPYGQSSTVSSMVAEVPGVEVDLERRVAEAPEDVVARTLLAHRQIVIGWDVRSGLRAEHVSREQFDQFHAWLRRAEQALIEVCAQYPNLSLPWHLRLMTARGLELGASETRRRYDRLAANHPDHLYAQQQLIQRLCPKWGGTWEAAFDFARHNADRAAAGSPLAGNIAMVHFERWMDDEKDTYLKDPSVVSDIAASESRSIAHPDYQPGYYDGALRSVYAALYALAGETERAVAHFRALGNFMDDYIWGCVVGPWRDRLQAVRAVAIQGGAR